MTQRSRLRAALDEADQNRSLNVDVPGSRGAVKVRCRPLQDDGIKRSQEAKAKTYDDRLRRAAGVVADSCTAVLLRGEDGEYETLSEGFTVDLARDHLAMEISEDLSIVDIVLEFYDGLHGHVTELCRQILDLSAGRTPGPLA